MKKSKKSQKKNPVRHLKETDIKKIKKDASNFALKYGVVLFLTVLRDKEDYNLEDIKRVYDELIELADSVNNGWVSVTDLEQVLKEEANIEIHL